MRGPLRASCSLPAFPRMNPGSASQFIVDLPAPVTQVQNHELGPIDSKGREKLQESLGPGPSKTGHAKPCTVQRGFLVFAAFGLLVGTAVGGWFLVKHLLKPFALPETPALHNTEALLTRCRDVAEEEEEEEQQAALLANGKKVSFRVNTETFLLEVQAGGHLSWFPVCHDSWNLTLGMWICRQMGHVRPFVFLGESDALLNCARHSHRLTHHKAVNLTDVKVNNARDFAQFLPKWKGNVEDMLQIRNRCASGRIVALKCSDCGLSEGHRDPPLGHWPWLVRLHLSPKHVCAGLVLSPKWIITAAHCVHKQVVSGQLVAQVGAKGQVPVAIEKILVHPHYGAQNWDNDLTMLKLKEPLNFSETTQAICLPRYHQTITTGSLCWIPGPENAQAVKTLGKVPVIVIGTRKCNSSCAHAGELTARMLCATYQEESLDACQSNSARPLVCQHEQTWHLVGIGSWSPKCTEPDHLGVFTKVTEFLDWIHHVMESD